MKYSEIAKRVKIQRGLHTLKRLGREGKLSTSWVMLAWYSWERTRSMPSREFEKMVDRVISS